MKVACAFSVTSSAMCTDISDSVTQRRDPCPFGLRRTFDRPGEFPANREKNRESLDFPAGYMKTSENLPVDFMVLRKNSLLVRTGN